MRLPITEMNASASVMPTEKASTRCITLPISLPHMRLMLLIAMTARGRHTMMVLMGVPMRMGLRMMATTAAVMPVIRSILRTNGLLKNLARYPITRPSVLDTLYVSVGFLSVKEGMITSASSSLSVVTSS